VDAVRLREDVLAPGAQEGPHLVEDDDGVLAPARPTGPCCQKMQLRMTG
jgi:hypothetical protein